MGNGQRATAKAMATPWATEKATTTAKATATAMESKATINQTMEQHGGLAPWSMATATGTEQGADLERGKASAVSKNWNLIL
jgi:hypothetical protein